MSNIWNPFAFGVTGQPMAPQTQALRVYGAEPSKEQLAMAQQTFAKFCMTARLSAVPNPMEQGFLPDGSKYRIVTVGNVRIMEVRVEAGEGDELFCGIYIDRTVLIGGVPTPAPIFLTVDGAFGLPGSNWKAEAVVRKHGPSGGPVPSANGRPHFASKSWHSPSGTEYYVQENGFDAVERGGGSVLSFGTSPNNTHLAVLTVHGVKSFCFIYRDGSSATLAYADAFDTKGATAPRPLVFNKTMPMHSVPAPTSSAVHTLESVVTSPAGDQALVTQTAYDPSKYPPVPTGTIGEWHEYPTIEIQYSYGSGLYERRFRWFGDEQSVKVLSLAFDGTSWSVGPTVHSSDGATCDPKTLWRMGSFGTRTRNGGGFRGKVLAYPTATEYIPPAFCSVRGSVLSDVVVLSVQGPHSYLEENELDAPFRLESDDQLNLTGAWLGYDDTPYVVEVSREAAWRMTSTGSTDYKEYRNFLCAGPDGDMHWFGGNTSSERTEISDFLRKRTRKTVARVGLDSLVLMDELSEEVGTTTETQTIDLRGSVRAETATVDASAALSIAYEQRRLLMADPQFRMLCFVEAEFSFSRGGSVQRTNTYNPTTDEIDTVITGGDSAAAPAPPTGYLVVTLAGVEVFRKAVPSSRPGYGGGEEEEIVVDCTVPWGMADRKGYFGSIRGMDLRDMVIYGHWPGGVAEHLDEPHRLGPTLGISMYPLYAAGAEYLAAEYAKDPKTGAAVLHIRNKSVGGTVPTVREIFTIDHTGLKPLNRLVSDIETAGTILGVAPT